MDSVAAEAFARDPYLTGTLSDAVASLKSYWRTRLQTVAGQL